MFRLTALARPVARAVSVRPLSVSVKNLLASDAVFAQMEDRIDAAAVAKVKGVFRFDIQEKKKTVKTWTADLKNGDGSLVEGEGTKPDVTIIVSDEDFVKLAAGELDAQKAFFSGKLKVKGNIMLSQKLGAILKN